MATVTRENAGNLLDTVTVTLEPQDYLTEFDKKLKQYGKTANIPGFRKGMVPAGMIKKMYGAGVYQEEVLRTVEKELYQYLSKEQPKIFGQPLPLTNDVELDMNKPAAYDFKFEMGLHPEIVLPSLSTGSFTKYDIEVEDTDVADEIDRIRLKGGKMNEPETIEEENDVLNVTFTEIDEAGTAIEGGIVKDNSVMFKYFSTELQSKLKGKKAGEEIEFTLGDSFTPETLVEIMKDLELDPTDAAAQNKRFKLHIDKLGRIEKREMEPEFYNEIFPGKNLQTEDEVKAAMKADLEQYWQQQAQNQLHDQIYNYLTDSTKFDLPEDFLKRWLKTGGEKVKTTEEVEKEFPQFVQQLRWTLISEKLNADKNIEVTDEEVKEQMRKEIMQYFGQAGMGDGNMEWMDSYIDRMMKDEKHVDKTYRTLAATKLFSALEADTKPMEAKVKGKEFVDIVQKKEK